MDPKARVLPTTPRKEPYLIALSSGWACPKVSHHTDMNKIVNINEYIILLQFLHINN